MSHQKSTSSVESYPSKIFLLLTITLLISNSLSITSKSTTTTTPATTAKTNGNSNGKSNSNTKGNQNIQSAYEYIPITALNQYGQSTQLRHAQLASSRYGALTLVAIATSKNSQNSTEDVIVCCTLPNPSPIGLKHKLTSTSFKQKSTFFSSSPPSSSSTLIHVLSYDSSSADPTKQTITALVGSGIKPDIQFVTKNLRDYSRRIWERYDVTPTPSRLSQALSQMCLSFMGYDLDREISDGVGPILISNQNNEDDGDDNDEPMARPLGIQVLLMGVHYNNGGGYREGEADMISVDAAGVQVPCHYWAMGKDGEEAYKLLRERWTKDLSVEQVKDMMAQIVKQVRYNDGAKDEGHENVEDEVVILPFEILSGKGITRSRSYIQQKREKEEL